ncbi:MAG: glycosyltransferase [Alphaproteobacteria bacterium]|nr:glycosyltransferase [Alphaproteobacteria bacterium]
MKVLHAMAGAPVGGAENIFLEDVLALDDAGVSQAVLTRANNDFRLAQFRARGIATVTAGFSSLWRWPTSAALGRLSRSFDPDIAQYWMGRAGTYARRGRAVNVGWYGGYYQPSRFANCDYHVGLTKDIVRHIIEKGVPKERTALIHTYAEYKLAEPVSRAELATPQDAPVLLSLARLHWKKGLDVLLKAAARVPGVYVWIAGDGPLRDELQKLAHELGVASRVRFLGWRDDRFRLLAACDVCVFPSRYEPFGTVTVDAWASGKPLIAADAQGPAAYVLNEVNGMLVPKDDVGALTSAINNVLEKPALRESIVAGGRAAYEAGFTKAAFQRNSLAFYERILEERKIRA